MDARHEYDVGFLVHMLVRISRLISIHVAAKPENVTSFQVYALTSKHRKNEVKEFYTLEKVVKAVPKRGHPCCTQ